MRAFDSAKMQSYKCFEHIIIDDGSTDNIYPLVLKYVEEVTYPVVYVKKENEGKHTGINIALDIAKGDYFLRLDSDDELLPNCVESLLTVWNQIPQEIIEDYWCVLGREIDQTNQQMIGDLYPENINEMDWSTARDIANNNYGDKIAMIRVKCIGDKRFPTPKYVKFVTENVLWSQCNNEYKTWYTNILCYRYYINDGECLSQPKMNTQTYNNSCWHYWYRIKAQIPRNVTQKLKEIGKYVAYYFNTSEEFRQEHKFAEELEWNIKILCELMVPLGNIIFKIITHK